MRGKSSTTKKHTHTISAFSIKEQLKGKPPGGADAVQSQVPLAEAHAANIEKLLRGPLPGLTGSKRSKFILEEKSGREFIKEEESAYRTSLEELISSADIEKLLRDPLPGLTGSKRSKFILEEKGSRESIEKKESAYRTSLSTFFRAQKSQLEREPGSQMMAVFDGEEESLTFSLAAAKRHDQQHDLVDKQQNLDASGSQYMPEDPSAMSLPSP